MSTKTQRHHHPGHASNTEMREGPTEKPAPGRQKVSQEERSRLIQVRAYILWEQAGKPEGDAARERFWCEAEKEIMRDILWEQAGKPHGDAARERF